MPDELKVPGAKNTGEYAFRRSEIIAFSKNIDELEIIINANKYNL